MASRYTPGRGFVDTFARDLDDSEIVDCGPLDDRVEAVCDALRKAEHFLWDAADALATAQSSPLYVSMVARSDAAAKQLRTDEAAKQVIGEINRTAIADIAASTDMGVAKDAVMKMAAFKRAIELAEAKQGAPEALSKANDLASHVDRVEKREGLMSLGTVRAFAFYSATMEEGNDAECIKLESAAEAWLQSIVRGGTAALMAANPNRYKGDPGKASADVSAALQFLNTIEAQRKRRVPMWLVNARAVYAKLENLAAKLVGQHVEWLSPSQSASLWTDGATLPNPLDVSPTWATRWLASSTPLPGWSRIEATLSNGGVRRAPAGSR